MWYIIVLFLSSAVAEYKYETKWFKVPLDHFGYQRNETFHIKYLVNDDYWLWDGPIFFYTGNEGQIELAAKHTGFIWEIAAQYRARVVFAEHRYYGESMPFGNKSLDNEHIGYLTSAQALADYADLADYFQGNSIRPHYPVIAFGGKAIGKVVETTINYVDKSKCVNYKDGYVHGNLDSAGWGYQICTEMVTPMCTTGKDDMFEPFRWNFTWYRDVCHKKYNVYPRENAARVLYGGGLLRPASNIVFSNGLLDPWAGGGILTNISSTVVAVVLSDTAHHLDLMPSNPVDPPSVKMAREIHKQNIDRWIKEFREYKFSNL